jgi:hypothetical protein
MHANLANLTSSAPLVVYVHSPAWDIGTLANWPFDQSDLEGSKRKAA